jgi:hypothetical protein
MYAVLIECFERWKSVSYMDRESGLQLRAQKSEVSRPGLVLFSKESGVYDRQ